MEESEKIYLATKAFEKKWDYETLRYSDDLYSRESFAEDIWEYVEELEEIGTKAFKELYKDYDLYI